MKFKQNFNRDFNWYLKMRHLFWFSGDVLRDKKGKELLIVYDSNGISGKEAFFLYDSTGKLCSTKHPNLLFSILKTKASANFHIKMYAETRATAELSLIEFRGMCIKWKAPSWFRDAVENQKPSFYKI